MEFDELGWPVGTNYQILARVGEDAYGKMREPRVRTHARASRLWIDLETLGSQRAALKRARDLRDIEGVEAPLLVYPARKGKGFTVGVNRRHLRERSA